MGEKRRTIVLDTSAFIAGFDPFAVNEELYSVPKVGEELTSGSLSRLRFDAAIERGRLRVLEPDSFHLGIVKESSKEIGDINFLSKADIKILALALQLKEKGYAPTILTDDYSIQNVSKKLEIDYAPLMTFGIRLYLHWILYCPACHKKYPTDYRFDRCENCGTRLKRKPVESEPAKTDFQSTTRREKTST